MLSFSRLSFEKTSSYQLLKINRYQNCQKQKMKSLLSYTSKLPKKNRRDYILFVIILSAVFEKTSSQLAIIIIYSLLKKKTGSYQNCNLEAENQINVIVATHENSWPHVQVHAGMLDKRTSIEYLTTYVPCTGQVVFDECILT